MVVGITVVGFGTSMPELLVSVLAAMRSSGGLSLGNAVGSNIMNLLLVLGLAATLHEIRVPGRRRVLQRDLLFGLLPACVILLCGWHGFLSRGCAVSLIGLFVVFMIVCLCTTQDDKGIVTTTGGGNWIMQMLLTAAGTALLVCGAELMVRGGVRLATRFEVSEAVIGLTLVAFGTSLPELATSVVAALKKQPEISVGNILGSNIFNLGLVVGTSFTIRPGAVPMFVIHHDVPFLGVVTLLVGTLFLKESRIGAREGVLLLLCFTLYLVFLVIRGT